VADWLDENDAKAVAVLATAAMRQLGRDAPVVTSLQRLLRERSKGAYDDACGTFDELEIGVRKRIASSAPIIARRRQRAKYPAPTLTGLLGVLNRR
jgi:hypothetical protein